MPTLRLGLDYRPALITHTGIGRAVRELSQALTRLPDVELHLLGHSLAPARHRPSQLTVDTGGILHRLPIPGRSMPYLAKLGLDAARLCGGVPLFHFTDYIHPPVNHATTVLTLHDLAFAEDSQYHGSEQSEILRQRSQQAAERATLVITPSKTTAAAAEKHLALPASKIRVAPFGCDHLPDIQSMHSFAGHPLAGEPFYLCLGTIEPRKNHLRLLQAYRNLPSPKPRLIVVGKRGWECDPAVRELHAAQQEGHVEWHEHLSDAQVFQLMANAEALLYPSLCEGFGFPPLEAMTLGTPVLAGDTPALRENLGTAALFCNPLDIESMTQGMAELQQQPDLRQDLAQRGKQHAQGFRWQYSAQKHRAIYAEALQVQEKGA